MLPVAHESCTPSWLQVKMGCWFGMHPPLTQMRPLPQVPPVPHCETQCSSMQIPFEPHVPPFTAQGLLLMVHSPLLSQAKPVGQGFVALHEGVQTPWTQLPVVHWVSSKH